MATGEPTPEAARPVHPMTARSLAVVGGGEHAVVVVEAARSRPGTWHILGFSARDDGSWLSAREPELLHLGDDAALMERLLQDPDDAPALVLGFGGGTQPGSREAAVARFGSIADWAVIVHATAWVSASAKLGPGTFVGAAAVVQVGAVAGRHVIINTGAIIEHDVVLGDFCHVAPAAAIGGGTRVGAGAFLGLGARLRDHISVGAGATIGMGAVVVDDVLPGRVVAGVPARELASDRG